MSQFFVGIFLMVISGICYGFAPILAVYAYDGGATVSDFVFLRYGIASVIFIFSIIIFKGRSFKKLTIKELFFPVLAGIAQAVAAYTYMSAVKELSAGLAAILFYTYPVWVAIWGFFFCRERLKVLGIAGIGVAMLGLMLAVGVSWGNVSSIGIIFGLISGLACSCFIMGSNASLKTLEPLAVSALTCIFTGIPLFCQGTMAGTLQLQMTSTAWLACAAAGIISCNIALLALMEGMKRVGSTLASVLCTIEPMTAMVLSALLLAQKMTIFQVLGGIVLIGGAALVAISQNQSGSESEEQGVGITDSC